jgi:dihydrofolate synthase/folylpolyglutamate synthase
VPVVSAVTNEEPLQVIQAMAADVGAPLFQRGVDYDFAAKRLEVNSRKSSSTGDHSPLATHDPPPRESFDYWEPAVNPRQRLAGIQLGMLGNHQAANAGAAIAAVNRLRDRRWQISDEALRRGLAAARCPARIELVAAQPAVILDVAHNPASVQALLDALSSRIMARRRILVFASSKDKDYAGMLRLLQPAFDVMIVTRYIDNPRAMEPTALLAIVQELRERAPSNGKPNRPAIHATARPADALRLAQVIAGPDDLICVTGSFFLAAELRPLLVQGRVETANNTNPLRNES